MTEAPILTSTAAAPLSVLLVLGYAAAVLLLRRGHWFDLPFHALVLLLIGLAAGGAGPARAIATAILATLLATAIFGLVFGTGSRSPGEHARTPMANRTATLGRPTGPPKPSVAR